MRARARHGLAAATAVAVSVVGTLVASPVFAATGPVGPKPAHSAENSGPGLSVLQTVLIYVGIPLALFVVIALLASAGSIRRSGRPYRPGGAWEDQPRWFNGPAFGGTGQPENRPGPTTLEGGGASARW
ncbi:MAG: aa3-type cytochrome oxidase subunit CtaJ [Actinomycetes bacterium]